MQLRWFESTNVISLKTQLHAVNACVKRSSQRSFNEAFQFEINFASSSQVSTHRSNLIFSSLFIVILSILKDIIHFQDNLKKILFSFPRKKNGLVT